MSGNGVPHAWSGDPALDVESMLAIDHGPILDPCVTASPLFSPLSHGSGIYRPEGRVLILLILSGIPVQITSLIPPCFFFFYKK